MKTYPRTKEYMAPRELLEVWPTGMSPVLQIIKPDGSVETLAESGHIIQSLIRNYDPKKKLTPDTHAGNELAEYYLHFAEGSLQPYLVALLVAHIASQKAPWPSGYLVKFMMKQINSQFYSRRLLTNLQFLDDQLAKKGGSYFVGDKLSGADIILDFPINENLFSDPERVKTLGFDFDLTKKFPNLYKWHQLTMKLPLRQRAVERENKAKKSLARL